MFSRNAATTGENDGSDPMDTRRINDQWLQEILLGQLEVAFGVGRRDATFIRPKEFHGSKADRPLADLSRNLLKEGFCDSTTKRFSW